MWLAREHNKTFIKWFEDKVLHQLSQTPNDITETIKCLAFKPKPNVMSYEGFDINGFTYYTKRQDDKSVVQNSGVTLQASTMYFASAKDKSPREAKMSYYGVIEDIWEFDYIDFKIPLFKCNWVDNTKGVIVDELGFTLVNFEKIGEKGEPFILASQAKQVFYIDDPANDKWSVVLHGKRQFIEDPIDEEEYYDKYDDSSPFSVGLPTPQNIEANDDLYVRGDHNEGLLIDKRSQF